MATRSVPDSYQATKPSDLTPDQVSLLVAQRARFPVAEQRASMKTRDLYHAPQTVPLLKAARNARSNAQRVEWLRRAAAAWAAPYEPIAACRKGCAHCCRISVAITRNEAELIGKATGRSVAKVDAPSVYEIGSAAEAVEFQAKMDAVLRTTPCPFLLDEACSTYAHRPMACRTYFNLDDDALLCQVVPGHTVDVPHADYRTLLAHSFGMQASSPIADIRDFFPPSP